MKKSILFSALMVVATSVFAEDVYQTVSSTPSLRGTLYLRSLITDSAHKQHWSTGATTTGTTILHFTGVTPGAATSTTWGTEVVNGIVYADTENTAFNVQTSCPTYTSVLLRLHR